MHRTLALLATVNRFGEKLLASSSYYPRPRHYLARIRYLPKKSPSTPSVKSIFDARVEVRTSFLSHLTTLLAASIGQFMTTEIVTLVRQRDGSHEAEIPRRKSRKGRKRERKKERKKKNSNIFIERSSAHDTNKCED